MRLILLILLLICEQALGGTMLLKRSGRQLTNQLGQAVFLGGWHTYNILQDGSGRTAVNHTNFFAEVAATKCNYVRLWGIDSMRWDWFADLGYMTPQPWTRYGNLLVQSEAFNTTWARARVNAFGAVDYASRSAGSGSFANSQDTLDPVGGNNADFVQEDGTVNNTHRISQTIVANQEGTYTFSVFVKPAGRSIVCLVLSGPSFTDFAYSFFDTQNGLVLTHGVIGAGALNGTTIELFGNGFYKCTVTGKPSATAGSTVIGDVRIAALDNSFTYSGDNTSGLFLYGASLRPASSPTNYVATTTTATGLANDGNFDFNLSSINPDYIQRLTNVVKVAGDNGVWVSVMLHELWTQTGKPTNWAWSPLNRTNNTSGALTNLADAYTLLYDPMTAVYTNYARAIVDALQPYDNALIEIANEGPHSSTNWQHYMVDVIQGYEATLAKQHPVIYSALYSTETIDNQRLLASNADVVAYHGTGVGNDATNRVYMFDPTIDPNNRPILLDTDHIWGAGGNQHWVFKAFTRGYAALAYMDIGMISTNFDYGNTLVGMSDLDMRQSIGDCVWWSRRVRDYTGMVPSSSVASTGYCLTNSSPEYLAFQPANASFTISVPAGAYRSEWWSLAARRIIDAREITLAEGSNTVGLTNKWGAAAGTLLYLRKL